ATGTLMTSRWKIPRRTTSAPCSTPKVKRAHSPTPITRAATTSAAAPPTIAAIGTLPRTARPSAGRTKFPQLRTRRAAITATPIGCRRSDVIGEVGQLADPRAQAGGGVLVEGGDVEGARGGVDADGGQPEPALQRPVLGLHVLDAGHRHER